MSFAAKNKIDVEITEQYIYKRNISDQLIDKFKQNFKDTYSKFLEIVLSLYNECFPKIKFNPIWLGGDELYPS